jgi:small-conductance mechanosensitive channel
MDLGKSVQNAFDAFFGFLPNLLGFLVLLLVGFIVAKIVAGIVRKVLEKAGLDRHLQGSDAHKYVDRVLPGASASNGIARVVFWLVFAFFLFAAIGALKIPAVTTFMNQVLAYLPNVIVAILIFVAAALIAGGVAAAVTNFMGDTPTGKIVAGVVPALVMVIALFMILDQLKIAQSIVTIAFAATMGALALGLALAFGLGGRDVARRMLEDAYAQGRRAKEQAREDIALGRERASDSLRDNNPDHATSASYSSADTTQTRATRTSPAAAPTGGYADGYDGSSGATSADRPNSWDR